MKWYDRCKHDDIKLNVNIWKVQFIRRKELNTKLLCKANSNYENKKWFPLNYIYKKMFGLSSIFKNIIFSFHRNHKLSLVWNKPNISWISVVLRIWQQALCVCGWVSHRANDHVYRDEWTTIELHMNAMHDLQPFSIFWSALCDHQLLFSDDKYRMWLRLPLKFLWNKKKTMKLIIS